MPKGTIKFFNEQRGYGFIKSEEDSEEDTDVYVHHSEIREDGYRTLKEGQLVLFDVKQSNRGLEAVNVQKLS